MCWHPSASPKIYATNRLSQAWVCRRNFQSRLCHQLNKNYRNLEAGLQFVHPTSLKVVSSAIELSSSSFLSSCNISRVHCARGSRQTLGKPPRETLCVMARQASFCSPLPFPSALPTLLLSFFHVSWPTHGWLLDFDMAASMHACFLCYAVQNDPEHYIANAGP